MPRKRTTPTITIGLILILIAFGCLQGCRQRGAPRGEGSKSASPVLPAPPSHTGPVTSYAEVVAKVAPAVVTVRSERRVRAPRMFPFTSDPLFREFFGDRAPAPRQQIQLGLGSGVIVTPDGYVLTNHHVIDGAEEIQVETADHRNTRAKVVGSDPPSDLAVLKIDAHNLTVLMLGDSDKVRVGDVVLALGNPLGVGQTVTAGIISAKERSTGLGNGTYESFLQTDAPINQGNSGGALVNTAGDLIGINSQILSTSGAAGGNIGIGFAIPSNMARQVSEQLIKGGNVKRGLIGVSIQELTPDMAASLGLRDVRGVIVNSVQRGGPADRAGMRQGDIITQINGRPVESGNNLRNTVAGTAPGSEIALTVLRDGAEQQVRVKVSELSPEAAARNAQEGQGDTEQGRFGLAVNPLTPELAQQLGLPPGASGLVVTEIDPVGAAAEAGIQPGDLIVQANRRPLRGIGELRDLLQQSGDKPVLLLVQRGRDQFYVTLRPR